MVTRTTATTGAAVLRRAAAAALISLAGGLGPLATTPQAALASTPGASSVSTGSLHTCAIESVRPTAGAATTTAN